MEFEQGLKGWSKMSESKCPSCNASTPEEARFCPGCGAALKAGETQAKSAKSRDDGKQTSMRDNLIIVGVIVLVTVSYFLYVKPQPVAQPPQQQTGDPDSPHGSDMGAMMAALPDIPADYEGLVQMGNETMDMGNYPVAAECYKRALAISGVSYEVRTDFGACLHAMGLPDRAIEEFYKVINEHPEHGIANYNLGIVYYGMQELDSARAYWEKYLEIDPNGQASKSARSFLKELDG